jgi:hypothetical protein
MTPSDKSGKRYSPTVAELVDDDSVDYALHGAVAWGALAISRALMVDGRRAGDPFYDQLLEAQRQLTMLKKDWPRG